MAIPVPCPSDGARPIDRVERRKATRRRGRFVRAVLHIAEGCTAVGLAVILLDSGGDSTQPCQLGTGEAATGTNRIRGWWTRWLTASIGLLLLRVVCRTRCGRAT